MDRKNRIQKRNRQHLLLQISLLILLAATIVVACQKTTESSISGPAFNTGTVKEWYYGSFKKTAEYSSYNLLLKGKKLPDWKNGKYKKLGNFEVIEFPLTREKTSLILPDNAGLREQDKKRVAEASLSRIVFVKNGTGHIIVREATYIPDPDYLARHQYDISSNSFGNVDKDFSGTIQVTKWNSTEISRSVLKEGKVEKRIRIKAINPKDRKSTRLNSSHLPTSRMPSSA